MKRSFASSTESSYQLWPDDKPQERVINWTVYWNRYGSSWLEKLLEAPFDRPGGHE